MKSFEAYLSETQEIGFVDRVNQAAAFVSGLPTVYLQELVLFENGTIGYVLSLQKQHVEILLLTGGGVKAGMQVTRTKTFLSIDAGEYLLGKTIDPFGVPLNPQVMLDKSMSKSIPIDHVPKSISDRKRIDVAFETGVSMVDLVNPLGKGQRELIIGDRKSGKTNFLLQTMLTQAQSGSICIYVAIGKKLLSIKQVEEFIKTQGIEKNCLIVASTASDHAGNVYITPYTGMALAEYFMDQGKDVFIILDDLTTHARYYREISLLIKRFPGRNSYPADIFYAHARLLERAGCYIKGEGQANITCFPVAETVQGDLSGFIQTNLMSMTDGHLYFDIDLFTKGRRPAVHPFLSVTRVGKQTQTSLKQTLNREILSFLSLHERMQNFTHFGAEVSETISNTLKMGEKVLAFFEQLTYAVLPTDLQMFLFSLVWIDTWHDKTIVEQKVDMNRIVEIYKKDEQLRVQIKDVLEKSDSFNKLLGQIRGMPDDVYKKLGLSS